MKYIRVVMLAWFLVGEGACAQSTQGPKPAFEILGEPRQIPLVGGLREISGLARATKKTVYAHNDEHGIIYEINLDDGSVVSAFAFGTPTARADFEGIAVNDGRVYLVSSNGLLYEALIGEHRKRVRYNIFDTGTGAYCEVEGLAAAPGGGGFLILCKTAKTHELEGRLTIYFWSVEDRTPVVEPWLSIPYDEFLTQQEAHNFRPSALDWDDERQALIILSARSHKLIVISKAGHLLYEMSLPETLHAQPEGVVITAKGEVVIADEGPGRSPGVLTVYNIDR